MARSIAALVGAAAPLALLAAALLKPSASSLPFLLAFGALQYSQTLPGHPRRPSPTAWGWVLLLAAFMLSAEAFVAIGFALKGPAWPASSLACTLIRLLGFADLDLRSTGSGPLLALLPQLAVVGTASAALCNEQQYASWRARRVSTGPIPPVRHFARQFALPLALLLAGAVRPSFASFVYFIFSCVGLLRWATIATYDGLSWAWRLLVVYTASHFLLLYCYQFPWVTLGPFQELAEGAGLFKLTYWSAAQTPEYLQAVALISLFWTLCVAVSDKEALQRARLGSWHRDATAPMENFTPPGGSLIHGDSLTTSLLHAHLDQVESDSEFSAVGYRRAASAGKWLALFHTYGFLLCLVALVMWTFVNISFAAFLLLLYVAFVFFAFPSSEKLFKTNPVLLTYIVLWTIAMYMFNVIHIDYLDPSWSVVGLWRYEKAGVQVLAQFCLAALWAVDVFTRNVLREEERAQRFRSTTTPSQQADGPSAGAPGSTRIFAIALLSWCIRKSAHVGALVVLFFVGISALDLLHAVYMMFFLAYLMAPWVARWASIYLITYCELHFAVLYLFRLAWFQGLRKEDWKYALDTIGLWRLSVLKDFAGVALLLCFSAVQYHGAKSLKQVEGENFRHRIEAHWTTARLAALVRAITRAYRQFGLYIGYVTVLLVIYAVPHSYAGLGYLVCLLVWLLANHMGQPVRHTVAWAPLMLFCTAVGIARYSVGAFPILLQVLVNRLGISEQLLHDLGITGHKSGEPMLERLWDSTVLLCTLQMYRFEQASKGGYSALETELEGGDHVDSNVGAVGFLKRLLILHANKALILAAFYASISPASPLGFVYLLLLVLLCNAPKTSPTPPRVLLLYTALLTSTEYYVQVAGSQWGLAPAQSHGPFIRWLGLQMYGPSSGQGTEAGLRSKALVLATAVLQLVCLDWLSCLPASLLRDPSDPDPCFLFLPYRRRTRPVRDSNPYGAPSRPASPCLNMQDSRPATPSDVVSSPTTPPASLLGPGTPSEGSQLVRGGAETAKSPAAGDLKWGRSPSGRWARKAHLVLRQERYAAQLRTIKVYLRHLAEHFFLLRGLEVCMVALLVAAFTVLNVFSLLYVSVLGACVVFTRPQLRRLWPALVLLFAAVLLSEYLVYAGYPPAWHAHPTLRADPPANSRGGHPPAPAPAPPLGPPRCHDCWRLAAGHRLHCWYCWLGAALDDKLMLCAYFVLFWLAMLQQRANWGLADDSFGRAGPAIFPAVGASAWREIAYEAKEQWTWLDHARFLAYRHLLLAVLILVFATGSLKYDLLHFGYLAFALIFFRMRGAIMERRNAIFSWLRLYNYSLIVASLLYQAPWFEYAKEDSCGSLFSLVGLYKYRYGADLQRGAMVDITIFCAVALQSAVLQTTEFAQMVRFLEAQELETRAHAHEEKAEWKKRELDRIRKTEDSKRQRRAQVLRLKKDILHLQLRLDLLNSGAIGPPSYPPRHFEMDPPGAARALFYHEPRTPLQDPLLADHPHTTPFDYPYYTAPSPPPPSASGSSKEPRLTSPKSKAGSRAVNQNPPAPLSLQMTPLSTPVPRLARQSGSASHAEGPSRPHPHPHPIQRARSVPPRRVVEENSDSPRRQSSEMAGRLGGVIEGVTMFGDQAMAQVQSLGGRALANLVDYLRLEEGGTDEEEGSSEVGEGLSHVDTPAQPSPKVASRVSETKGWPEEATPSDVGGRLPAPVVEDSMQRLSILLAFLARSLRANTDKVCYVLFVLVFVWNFSLLTLAYPVALFTYALLVNPAPCPRFWLTTLIYTELNILLQYTYQIPSVSRCHVVDANGPWARWLALAGIRSYPHSFVMSVLPLFLVYMATLVHASIKAQDGEWTLARGDITPTRHADVEAPAVHLSGLSWVKGLLKRLRRYVYGLVWGSEAPPHFVLVSMLVPTEQWAQGIQPGKIEVGINALLAAAHAEDEGGAKAGRGCSRVRVESVEQSGEREDIALAILEVLHSGGVEETLTPAGDVAAQVCRLSEEGRAQEVGFPYPIESVVAGGRREVDLYAYTFGVDLLAFFFVALCYNSAVGNKSLFFATYDQDQFPKEYVWVLVTLFVLMVVDRVLYLCSFAKAKVAYYAATLALYSGYTMRLFWSSRLESSQTTFQLFFLLKALSFALAATQIKYGAPRDSAMCRQFLMRRINHLHWLGFAVYRALPFVYELRTVLDWSCATTSLIMYDWLKMEDIYASLFIVQCDIKLNRNRHRLGQKQELGYKFCSGVVLFAVLCTTIWAPMLMYSTGNPSNLANPITDLRMSVQVDTVEGMFPLYEGGARRQIHPLYKPEDMDVLRPYDPNEIQLLCCYSDADTIWQIPPPTQRSLPRLLDAWSTLRVSWQLARARPAENAVVLWESTYNNTEVDVAEELRAVFNGSQDSASFPALYPQFLRVPGLGNPRVLEGTANGFVGGSLMLHRGPVPWWSFMRHNVSGGDDCGTEGGPMLVAVSEEVPGGIIGKTLSKFGMTGLYISFVLGVGRFFRLWVSDLRMRIPYENFPACDRLVAICEDIYAARAEGELELEEGLFWTLIKIYRSPHILLEYTKADKVD